MKKIISILLVLLMTVAALPLYIAAETSITEGALTWSYNESTETLTVSGEGEMPDYEWISTEDRRNGVTRLPEEWTRAKHVVVNEGVTSIGDWAFIWFEEMSDISLPETLTKIGKGAFENTYLYSIEFPESLVELEGCFCTTEPPKVISFKGDAPNLDNWTDFNMTVTLRKGDLTTILYSEDNATWTDDVKAAFGPRITWNGNVADRPIAVETFDDVKESYWYYDSLQYVYERELMIGTTATTFSPDAGLTRAQAMQMLFNMSGEYPVDYSGQTPFKDVSANAWCASAVNWAVEYGITKGVSETEFAPNRLITRQELATMLYSFARSLNASSGKHADISVYDDASKVANWARTSVCWCVGVGIISGMTETALAPAANTNRAQTARMLKQFYTTVLDSMEVVEGGYRVLIDYIKENGIAVGGSTEENGIYYYTVTEDKKMLEVELDEFYGEYKILIKHYPDGPEEIKDGRRTFKNYVRISIPKGLAGSYDCHYICQQPTYEMTTTGYLTPDGFVEREGRFSYGLWNGTKYVYDESKYFYGYEKRDTAIAEALEFLNLLLSECGLKYNDIFING